MKIGSLHIINSSKGEGKSTMYEFRVNTGFESLMPFCCIFLLSFIGISMPSVAENITTSVQVVRTIDAANLGVSTLSGLGYSTQSGGAFILTGREVNDSLGFESDPLKILPQKMIGAESFSIVISDSKNITFDDAVSRLLVHRVSSDDIVEVEASSNGDLSPTLLENVPLASLGIQNLKGMAVDPSGGTFFLLDGDTQRIVIIKPDATSRFTDATITELNLTNMGLGNLTAIAFNPSNGFLYLFDGSDMMVRELSDTGELRQSYDFSGFGLNNPGAMVFAPTGDLTDDPAQTNLYLIDHNNNTTGLITDKQGVTEFSLNREVTAVSFKSAALLSAPTVPVFLVQSIDSSQFIPPSPDSAGITYLESTDTLLITDSEVNEIPSLFTGVNVFESTVSGILQNTFSTTTYSLEPTGISVNPNNDHFFVSDDDIQAIFEIDPGLDGIRGTLDDIVTSFNTVVFGSFDPEGVTFASDVGQGDLFIADGANQEIYHIAPGSNGVFDGQPPAGDDILVGSFDTAIHGVFDPEGIEYDLENGTLYISSGNPRSSGNPIIEVDINGNLVRRIDISAVNYTVASGIALAPGSQDPNVTNLFVADRGVDNNDDPNENDGQIHELTFNQVPTVNAGADQAVVLPNTAILNGSVTDDALPPPGTITVIWSMISGPGIVTFADPTSLSTTASFTQDGIYVLRLTADDGLGQSTDDVTITATNPSGSQLFSVSANLTASADDAEERPTGAIPNLTDTDLEMIRDVGENQTVGLRFSGLDIPQGVVIQDAYIQFIVDETDSRATTLLIEGENADNAVAFSAVAGDISNRGRTNASVSWSPAGWPTVGEAGIDQRTSNIAPIIQEIINRPGWSNGNAIAFVIEGDGKRVARSYDFSTINAPSLHVEYVGIPVNQAPVVNAGVDQSIILPGNATLDGTVTDDGLPNPPAQFTVNWSKVSGPGSVTFASPTSEDTTASFSEAGNYVLRLTADDSDTSSSDDITITVFQEGFQLFSTSTTLAASSDDAEERPTGAVPDLTGTDLEMVRDVGEDQTVGLRFSGLNIPPGVAIQNAYIQFIVDETDSRATTLLIEGENTDNAATFSAVTGDISNRARTNASVTWSPAGWPTIGEAGIDQRTSNLAPIIQEIINHPGWSDSNAIAFMIEGDGKRIARSYDFSAINAPSLHIEYISIPINQVPAVNAGVDQNVILPGNVTLDGTVTDDGLPNPPAQITVSWSKVSGPGSVTFADPTTEDTTASFSEAGNYVLRLTADDDADSSSDDINITVFQVGSQVIAASTQIIASSDDAEERPTGAIPDLTGTDLEMVRDVGEDQTVGLRFSGLGIPQGVTIQSAYIQFIVDETDDRATTLLIEGENTDNAATFSSIAGDISNRSKVNASVSWSPAPWMTIGEAGIDQRTTDITPIIQEIINRSGWSNDNGLVLIVTGDGKRVARSYDFSAINAPSLHVEYISEPVPNQAPTVSAGADQVITLPDNATLDGTVADDGLPTPPGQVSVSWSTVSGPGTVTFADPASVDTTATFSQEGDYILRLTGDDGGASPISDDIAITVQTIPTNQPPVVYAGADQVITLPDTATLDGTITDDGLPNPPGQVSASWSTVSGPGTVTFADPTTVDTTASFSQEGDYVLRLTGDDGGALPISDDIAISVESIPTNQAPAVFAGADQVITLPDTATLDGTVTDDGLPTPPGQVTVNWSAVSGPGTVTFADPASVDTTASFSQSGSYVLRLIADDGGGLLVSDDIAITASQMFTISKRIATGSDDAEERPTGTSPDLTSNDLELTRDHGETQTVGLRFSGLDIPQGATIQTAYVQFKTDEVRSRLTTLLIEGENSDNALTFTSVAANISSRPKTNASVSWSPAPWEIIDEEGVAQRTTDIALIIQEIVSRPDWLSGNALSLIISGTGKRVARAFERKPTYSPLLYVEYLDAQGI